MKTDNIIIKCIDHENYSYFGIFGCGFSFDVEIIGCDFLVNFYKFINGEKAEKVFDILLEFEVDDVHDCIEFVGDNDDFIPNMAMDIQAWLENSISEQIVMQKPVIDLSGSIRALMEDMTVKAYAHLKVIRAQKEEAELYNEEGKEE